MVQKEKNLKKDRGVISNVKIVRISSLPRKPAPVGFHDTEIIVVTAKKDGESVKETFYTCIKPDHTVDVIPLGRGKSTLQRLYRFVKYYKLAEKLEGYDIVAGIKTWIGKPVEIVNEKIYIP
ncbi:MAG: hypothetical protein HY051_00310 [Candidatus Aenigmarchaeota archaeon]|nr:hypothetical protein [Candidatus Aenigmarchaeota archaeon]